MLTDDISQIGTFAGVNGEFPRGTDCSTAADIVTCRILNVTNGHPASVTFDVRVDTCPQTPMNAVTIAPDFPNLDPNAVNDAGTVTSQFACADFAITKVASPDVVPDGELLTYTLGVVNHGPLDETAVVTDTLPSEVDFVSAVAAPPGCDFTPATRVLTCVLGPITNGSGTTIAVVVRANRPGFVTNCAHVAIQPPPVVGIVVAATSDGVTEPFDPNLANNDSCTSTLVRSRVDLTITKTASPAYDAPRRSSDVHADCREQRAGRRRRSRDGRRG